MMFHFLALAFSMVMPPDAPVGEAVGQVAPAAPAGARYCLRVEPITGSRIETIRCETREGWAFLDVDVDQEWAKEGIRVLA